MNELLANMISEYSLGLGRAFTKKVALKLATSRVEERMSNVGSNAYALAKTTFSKCGTIFEENIDRGMIFGIIMSGAANMNPAFLLVLVEGNDIYLTASAKEGFIKQHTAEGAMNVFKSVFAHAEDL